MKNFVCMTLLAGLALMSFSGAVPAQSMAAAPLVEQAVIRGTISSKHKIYKSFNERLVVSHLNGKSLWQPTLASLFTSHFKYPAEIEVPPGRHRLSIHYSNVRGAVTLFSNQDFWLDAEAGQIYQLKADVGANAIRVWIEEADTGRVVGGQIGAEA